MGKYSQVTFPGKHVDEVVLHYCKPSKIQLKLELFRIVVPFFLIVLVIFLLFYYQFFGVGLFSFLLFFAIAFFIFSFFYKMYRAKNNYLVITSKRILFHGLEGFFKDYVKKISYENIRNINYFTESFFGRIFKYGTLEIQSSHGGEGDIKVYHIENGKMLTHYIDKLISLNKEHRGTFSEFDPNYFKNWKKK